MTIRAKQDLRVVFVNDGVEFAVINGGVALHDSRVLVDGTPWGSGPSGYGSRKASCGPAGSTGDGRGRPL